MTSTPFHFVRVIAFCALLALVASCGKGTEAVQGTTVHVSPDIWGVQTYAQDPTCHGVLHYQVSAISPTGYPQIGAAFQIDSPNGYVFYEGFVPASPDLTCGETVTGYTPIATPYTATADNSGTYRLTVVFRWTGGVKATATAVQAFSGTALGKSDLNFTCQDLDGSTTTLPNCPQ